MKLLKDSRQEFAVMLCLFLVLSAVMVFLFTLEVGEHSLNRVLESDKEYGQTKQQIKSAPHNPAPSNYPISTPDVAKHKSASIKIPPLLESQETLVSDFNYEDIVNLVDTGNWQLAEQKLLEVLAQNPNLESALIELAMIQILDKKDALAAKPYLERAVQLNPNNDSVIEELIAIYQDSHQVEAGLTFFKELAFSDLRENGAIDYGIASSLQNLGHSSEAIEYYHRASEQPGVDPEKLQHEMVDAYIDAGEPHEAIALLEELSTHDDMSYENQREIRIKLASVYLSQGDQEEALVIMGDWVQEHPRDDFAAQIYAELSSNP